MNDPTPPPLPARTGPLPFTVLVDEAVRLVRRHFRAIYLPLALPLALLALATGVFQALFFQSLAGDIESARFPGLSLPTILLALAQGIVLGLAMIALQKATVDAVAGRPIDMKEAWRFALQPAVVGTLFLQFLLLTAAAVFCLLPVLYVGPLLSLTGAVMAEERLYGGRALSRSSELTRHNPQNSFWETALFKAFLLMIITVAVSYFAALLVTLPFQVPMFISMFRRAAAGEAPAMGEMAKWMWVQIPSQVLQMLASVAVYTYSSFGFALLFFDTRSRKEGGDLAAEIHQVFGPAGDSGL
jgi:hypothetical protein